MLLKRKLIVAADNNPTTWATAKHMEDPDEILDSSLPQIELLWPFGMFLS